MSLISKKSNIDLIKSLVKISSDVKANHYEIFTPVWAQNF